MRRVSILILAALLCAAPIIPFHPIRSHATVNEVTARNDYTGNGSAVAFTYTFRILTKNDIEVLLDGVTKTVETDYTVSGLGDSGGATVTFTTAAGRSSALAAGGG